MLHVGNKNVLTWHSSDASRRKYRRKHCKPWFNSNPEFKSQYNDIILLGVSFLVTELLLIIHCISFFKCDLHVVINNQIDKVKSTVVHCVKLDENLLWPDHNTMVLSKISKCIEVLCSARNIFCIINSHKNYFYQCNNEQWWFMRNISLGRRRKNQDGNGHQ